MAKSQQGCPNVLGCGHSELPPNEAGNTKKFQGYIKGNVHIEYRRGHSTCGAAPVMPHFPAAVLPAVRSPQRTLSIWPCRSLSLWVKCSQLWLCRRGVNARIDIFKDFHLQWKIEYKSGFIGNSYKKVVYLGKVVYDTPACSLV